MIARAVVTGAGGFIGSRLCESLVDASVPVTAISRREFTIAGCKCLVADLRAPETLQGCLDSKTVVFHLAGHTSVAGSVRDPWLDFQDNVTATLRVLNAAVEAQARVVIASSAAVFQPGQALPLSETALKRPSSPYGAAKLACEGYAQAFHASLGLDVRIARLFNVYGPTMRKFAIVDFYQKLQRDPRHLEVLGDGEQIRDYLYIDDTVAALLAIAERGVPGADYNVASGRPTPVVELARLVAGAMDLNEVQITVTQRSFPGDIPRWYADTAKVRALGFEPRVPLLEGLAMTINGINMRKPRHTFLSAT